MSGVINGHAHKDAIEAVQNWATEPGNEDFDLTFVNSLAEGLEKHGSLTERQAGALSNIIAKFRINVTDCL